MEEATGKGGMVEGMAILAGFQLFGEILVRYGRLPFPAAVVGMFLLFLWLLWRGRVPRGLNTAANGLLDNLALLFVPATVGAFLDLGAIGSQGWAVAASVVASTFLSMAATAGAFLLLERRGGRKEPEA